MSAANDRPSLFSSSSLGNIMYTLLIHGLTAEPAQLVAQKEALEDTGAVVRAPMLAGHGTRVEDLARCRWEDWYADVVREARAWQVAAGGAPIDYVGVSLGGLLGLQLAIDHPEMVRRMVCICTPLFLFRWVECLLPLLRHVPLRAVQYWKKDTRFAVSDPEGAAVYSALGYNQMPLASVVQLMRLQKIVRANLARVTTPLFVMHARQDRTAHPRSLPAIAAGVRGPVQTLWLENSYHVATLDFDRELINQKMLEFFR